MSASIAGAPVLVIAGAAILCLALIAFVLSRRLDAAKAAIAEQQSEIASKELLLSSCPLEPVALRRGKDGEVKAELSAAAANMLGLPESPTLSLPDFMKGFAEADRGDLEAALNKLWRSNTSYQLKARLDGERGVVEVFGMPSGPGSSIDYLWLQDVTNIEKALERLTDERDGLRLLLDSLPLPVWRRNADFTLTNCNAAYAAALESTRDAVLEAGMELLGQNQIRQARALSQEAVTSTGQVAKTSHVVIDGSRRLLRLSEERLPDSGLLGFATDETPLEELQAELKRHVNAQAEVLENLGTAMAIFGADMHLTFFNSAYVRLWGIDEAFFQSGPHLGDVLEAMRERRRLPEQPDFPAYKQDIIKAYSTLIESREELVHLPDDSTLRMLIVPHPFGGVLLSYEDVTDRLAMERNYNTLIEVQRETLDKLYEGVAVYGADGRLALFNPGFAELWNLSTDWLETKPHVREILEASRLLFSVDDPVWMDYLESAASATTEPVERKGRRERADGSVLDWAQVPLPDGQVLYTFVDVTDSIHVERALMERNEALETADRLKSEFIANISYELRTPLNAIIGFAEILGNQFFGPLNERQVEYSNAIVESSQRLITLINDILDLASIEAGYLHIDLEAVDVRELMDTVYGLVRERAHNQGLELSLDCAPDVGVFQADSRRLKQALFNLVSNSLKFTPSGGRITLSAQRNEAQMRLSVVDTGVGIAEKDQDRVFGSFERGSRQGRQSGVGLGLSLVRSLIELHGGKVSLESELDGGTKVTCQIPLGREDKQVGGDRAAQ